MSDALPIHKAKAFRDELAELCGRYGLVVKSCGCCDEWIEQAYGDAAQEIRSLPVRDRMIVDFYDRKEQIILPGDAT